MKILLEKKDFYKLEILQKIETTMYPLSTDDLASFLKTTRINIVRYIKELNDDLVAIYGDNVTINELDSGYFSLTNTSRYTASHILDQLNFLYLEKNVTAELIALLLEKKFTSVNDILDELAISLSYFYKVSKKIQLLLEPFNLKLSLTTDNLYNFEGSLANLRIFAFTFFWRSYRSIKWPPALNDFPISYLEELLTKSSHSEKPKYSSKNRRYFLMLAVFMKYREEECGSLKLEPESIPLMAILSSGKDLSTPLIYWLKSSSIVYTPEYLEEEKYFFNYLLHKEIHSLFSHDEKIAFGEALTKTNTYHEVYLPLLQHVFIFFSLNSDNAHNAIFSYHMTIYYIYINFFQVDITQLIPEHPTKFLFGNSVESMPFYLKKIETCVSTFNLKNKKLANLPDSYKKVLFNLIYYIYSTLNKPTLNIYIDCTSGAHMLDFLTETLLDFFGTETIHITDQKQFANIVISDSDENVLNSTTEFFLLDKLANPSSIKNLLLFIHQKIFEMKFRK